MKLKVLFVGDLNFYSKGSSRLNSCQRLGCDTRFLSHTPIGGEDVGFIQRSLFFRLCWKFNLHLDTEKTNQAIITAIQLTRYDILWIEKGNMIKPATLQKVKEISPHTIIISYSDDDMFITLNHTHYYVQSLKYYHIVFTTKSHNLHPSELEKLGAKKVMMVDKAYDTAHHLPTKITEDEKNHLGSDVGFIGSYAPERLEM